MDILNNVKLFLKRLLPPALVQYVRRYRYVTSVRDCWPEEMTIIQHLIDTGDKVIDIGANYGWFTGHFSRLVGQGGLVYSIEPVPSNFRILSHVINKLGKTNVKLLQYAVSNVGETVRMGIPKNSVGYTDFYQASILDSVIDFDSQAIVVEAKTLDSLIGDDSGCISFIKCDVEGHELWCLLGAEKVILNSHPAWLIEVMSDPDDPVSNAYKVFELLHKEGYISFVYNNSGLQERKQGERKINYFFLQQSHIKRLISKKISLKTIKLL
jgi:FkbM family methyltransferase